MEVTAESLRIEADPTRIEQVIVNLLSNASKYTDPGGSIVLRVERRGPEALISVLDDGIGIAADMLPVIFDLFTAGRPLARPDRRRAGDRPDPGPEFGPDPRRPGGGPERRAGPGQ